MPWVCSVGCGGASDEPRESGGPLVECNFGTGFFLLLWVVVVIIIINTAVFTLLLASLLAGAAGGMPVTVRQMTAKDAKRIVPLCGAMERKTFPKHESLAASFEREVSQALH